MKPAKSMPTAPDGCEAVIITPRAWNKMARMVEWLQKFGVVEGAGLAMSDGPGGRVISSTQTAPVIIQITSTLYDAVYNGKILFGPINNNVTAALQESDLGTIPTSENAIFWNLSELSDGTNALDLTMDDQTFAICFPPLGVDQATGFPIFIGYIIAVESCDSSGGGSYSTSIGDGSSSTFTVTHGLGTQQVTFSVMDNSTNAFVYPAVLAPTTNTLSLVFSGAAPMTAQYQVTVKS